MKERLQALMQKVDDMTLRERGLVFLSLVFVVYLLWSTALMGPLEKEQQALLKRMNQMQSEITTLEHQIQGIISRGKRDPDAPVREQLALYQDELEQVNDYIDSTVGSLIKPQQMAKVLEEVLTRDTRLTLLKVESLGSEPLISAEVEEGGAAAGIDVGIYRHGLRLEFEGDYLSALAYLKAVQALPWALYWDGFDIVSVKYPKAHITIDVHTLSLQEGWIGV